MRRNGKAAAMLAALSLTSAAMSLCPALAAEPRSHHTYTVVINKMRFGPLPSGLRVGDTIIWENRDLFRHTATARDGSFDIDLMPTKKGKLVLKQAGTFRFSCTYHPGMKGELVVR
jgi:plastocyanin